VGNEGLWAVSVGGSRERIPSLWLCVVFPVTSASLVFLVLGWSLVPAQG
jgi:hypothetical protein